MTGHGLRRTHRNLISKQISYRMRFEGVADGRRGAMSVHVADDACVEFRIAQRIAHDAESAFVFGSRLRHVISVGGHAVANKFGENRSATPTRVFELFENQNARAFAHHEAIAILIPGTAGAGWVVIADGKRAHRGESANAHGSNGGLGAS